MSALKSLFETTYNEKRPSAFIVKLKKNKNGELDELKEYTQFLDNYYENPPVNQRLVHYIKQDFHIYSCKVCGLPCYHGKYYYHTCNDDACKRKYNYIATKEAIKKKYGVENISQTSEWKEKVSTTNLKRRGVKWNTQSKELIDARKKSWKENKEEQLEKRYITNNTKYGYSHAIQNEDVKEKHIKSLHSSSKYKIDRIEKIKNTNYIKYGSEWYMSTDSFKKKSANTLYEKYGIFHNSHNAETLDKRWKKTTGHNYKFPSGKTVRVQGYEPICIDNLLNEGYLEEDIIVGNAEIEKYIGKITYVGNDNQIHRYYPDIYIKSKNCVIEVKSSYTFSTDTEIYNKQQAILNANIKYELRII